MTMLTIIGQAPSRTSDPRRALRGRSGAALARLLGIDPAALGLVIRRRNLLSAFPGRVGKGDRFPLAAARRAAARVRGRRLVLLGYGVAAAFGVPRRTPPLVWVWLDGAHPRRVAIIPHPSGINRWWNAPANRRRAAAFLQAAVVEGGCAAR